MVTTFCTRNVFVLVKIQSLSYSHFEFCNAYVGHMKISNIERERSANVIKIVAIGSDFRSKTNEANLAFDKW